MAHVTKTERNDRIFRLYEEGWSYEEIAVEFEVAISRVQQIVGVYVTRVIHETRPGIGNPILEFKTLRRAIQEQHQAARRVLKA